MNQTADTRERFLPVPRWIRGGAGLGLTAALVLLLLGAGSHGPGVPCLFHELTGLSCLTCGMTRSLAAIGNGDFAAALAFHLFGPVVAGATAVASVALVLEAVSGRRLIGHIRWRAGLLAGGALALLYGALRMAVELIA